MKRLMVLVAIALLFFSCSSYELVYSSEMDPGKKLKIVEGSDYGITTRDGKLTVVYDAFMEDQVIIGSTKYPDQNHRTGPFVRIPCEEIQSLEQFQALPGELILSGGTYKITARNGRVFIFYNAYLEGDEVVGDIKVGRLKTIVHTKIPWDQIQHIERYYLTETTNFFLALFGATISIAVEVAIDESLNSIL